MNKLKNQSITEMGNKGGIARRILLLIAVILFGFIMGDGVKTEAASGTLTYMNDSYYQRFNSMMDGKYLRLGASTYDSCVWSGVSGLHEDCFNGSYNLNFFYIPYTKGQNITYTDFLDVYFKNIGSIGGRKINAKVHCDSLSIKGEWTPGNNQFSKNGYVRILNTWSNCLSINGDSAGSMRLRITVTITYADTGHTVELPFFQAVRDIDSKQSYIEAPESWRGISGYTGRLFAYESSRAGNSMSIDASNLYAYAHAGVGTSGDAEMLEAGLFATTSNGQFTMEWTENSCASSMFIYSSYTDSIFHPPVKSADQLKIYEQGEDVVWTMTQDIGTWYVDTFTPYSSFSFTDILPPQTSYQSARVLVNGNDVTNSFGTLQYDPLTRKVTYSLKGNVLGSETFYDGKTLTLEIKTKAENSTKNVAIATNTGSVSINGAVKTSNKVSVNINPRFQVTTEIEHGTITEPAANIPIRSGHTVTWKAKDGYYVESVTVDGAAQSVKKADGDSCTFSNITADHHVKVVCRPYRQITTEVSNGTITGKITSIKNGENHVVTWIAKEGCYVESVTVDGTAQSVKKADGDSYTFGNITADHHVKVVCRPYRQITTEVSNGTITGKITSIKNGENHVVTWKAKDGYYVESVTVDGMSQTVKDAKGDSYAFSDIVADHHVKVVCRPYHKIKTEIDHGTITPDQDKVKRGEKPKIVWKPEDGYYVKTVMADGVIIYNGNSTKEYDTSYTFAPITGDHKIVVKAAIIPNLKLTKTSDKNTYNYQETITYTIRAEQTIEGATADHVVITDKDITKGVDFDLSTLKVSDSSARIEKDETGNSFTVKLIRMSDVPVTITVKAKVNNEKLESKEIKNTARIVSDQTEEITDDSNISVYYRVTTRVTNGTITPDDEKIGRGEERVISYQPKDDSYYLESVKIDGERQSLKDCRQKTDLKNIRANYCIEVVYKKIPDIKIQKSADRKVYSSGEVITYTIRVSQPISSAVAEHVVISDASIPEGITLISDTITCDNNTAEISTEGNSFTVSVPEITAGKIVTVTFQAQADGKKLKSSKVTNTAAASFWNAESVEDIKKASCQVSVKHKITTEAVNGYITNSADGILLHNDKTVSYRPRKGYYLESVTVDGEKISITDHPDQYTFRDICEDHKIRVNCQKIPVLGITKTSNKTICHVNDKISFAIKVSQKAKGASAENVVITDEGVTPGLKIKWDSIFLVGAEKYDYKIIRTGQGGFRLMIKKFPNGSGDVQIMYDAVVEDPALAGTTIHNTARVTCDHSEKEELAVWQGTVKEQPAKSTYKKMQTAAPLVTARPTTTPGSVKKPDTGDGFPLAGVTLLFFVSGCGATGMGFWYKKKKIKKRSVRRDGRWMN